MDTLDTLAVVSVTSYSVNASLFFSKQPIALILGAGGASGITLTLPSAAGGVGKGFTIKKSDATSLAAVTIVPSIAAQKIDGAASYVLSNRFQYVMLISDGNLWNIGANN